VNVYSISKLNSKRHKVSSSVKKISTTTILIVSYLSMTNHSNIIVLPISTNADHGFNMGEAQFVTIKYNASEMQQRSVDEWVSAYVTPVADKGNIITVYKMIDANNTIFNQYIITLKDEVTRTPESLQNALDNLTAKVQSEGAKVIHIYKHSIKGLAIKVPNEQILAKLLDNLRNDPSVATIEPDRIAHAF
jgi:hypothetical protein